MAPPKGMTPATSTAPSPALMKIMPQLLAGGCSRVLVPGMPYVRPHDAMELAKHGDEVVALATTESACAATKEFADSFGKVENLELRCESFLKQTDVFDVVWDGGYFAALEPSARKEWGEAVDRVVSASGDLVMIVSPIGKDLDKGAPYGFDVKTIEKLIAPGGFEAVHVIDLDPTEMELDPNFPAKLAIFRRPGACPDIKGWQN